MNAINLKASENHHRPQENVRISTLCGGRGGNHPPLRQAPVSLTDGREQKGGGSQPEGTWSSSPSPAGRKGSEESRGPWTECGDTEPGGVRWRCACTPQPCSEASQMLTKHNKTKPPKTLCRSSVLAGPKATTFHSTLSEFLSVYKFLTGPLACAEACRRP